MPRPVPSAAPVPRKLPTSGADDSSEPGQATAEFSAGILRGHAAAPEEILGTALYLASSDSDYLTGQAINVTGGMVMH